MARDGLIRSLIVGVYAALIACASLLPSDSLGGVLTVLGFSHADKLVHFTMYGLLAVLLVWSSRASIDCLVPAALVIAVCALYGCLMEILQRALLPGDRCFSFADLAANTAGAVVAVVLMRRRGRRGEEVKG